MNSQSYTTNPIHKFTITNKIQKKKKKSIFTQIKEEEAKYEMKIDLSQEYSWYHH